MVEVGAVDEVDSLFVCCGPALGCLAVVCSIEDRRVLRKACVIELKTAEAAYVVDDVVEKVKLERN